ncbi:hypothetical protein M501DRAFT_997344 [Patellaria atrata CBS 101060]|uniref:Uncharacterized protein n=1 Tax=Patellaria atrata CBS 101060 TaxID=1346257 RepID=A0A9P4S6S8_9PEZI|nr:hypothetical protein M501DRAFT_997344 [Patellaria atrata CBS 101060]
MCDGFPKPNDSRLQVHVPLKQKYTHGRAETIAEINHCRSGECSSCAMGEDQ